jgi:predicted phosphate transport protein (TIGR00153 family)
MMEWIKRFFKPRQDVFQLLLIQQGEFAISSVEALQKYLKNPGEKRSEKAKQMERDADEVQRILIHELEDTFVTPLDREDIFALSQALDNFIDYVYDTVAELEIFDLTPSKSMNLIANHLLEMAQELHLAMQRIMDHPRVAGQHARRIKKIENDIETAYRESLAEMFSGPEEVSYLMEALKAREVLRHMSNASDQGDRAADVILDIGIKWY